MVTRMDLPVIQKNNHYTIVSKMNNICWIFNMYLIFYVPHIFKTHFFFIEITTWIHYFLLIGYLRILLENWNI